ncbi:MFS transporter [Allocoleopsis franciscana]|uniref:Major Facilitator Superfamily transporter n=1 Tax=Allocoleopsis franciscana PCC 7113 TaxID=1173027 RepID=K9WHC5_9CYAN|nr:MFS transporter [Allocoleopsis franciscana]AFZ19820.1 Major Facilitator Superfamily transporter [Allocoleopsis franciscana PCC 7113]
MMKNQRFERDTTQSDSHLNPKVICLSAISLAVILGISHGVADAAAGFLLGSLPRTMSLEQASWLIILYNILGFGYQPLAGILTDHLKRPRESVLLGLFLLLLALVVAGWQSQLAVVLAGMGSAAFHVGGGSLALSATPNRTTGPGFFAAPGAVGLAVGGVLGLTGYSVTVPLVLLLGVMIGVIALINLPRSPHSNPKFQIPNSKSDDWVMLVLLVAIALISTVWTSFQFVLQTHLHFILALAVAAAIAKVFGAILAQRWGWRRWIAGTFTVATLLLLLGGQNPLTLLLSLALLQSSIPITLAATAQMMPQQPATAAGLALGLAIIIGGIPVIGGWSTLVGTPTLSALVVTVTAVSLHWVFKSITLNTPSW